MAPSVTLDDVIGFLEFLAILLGAVLLWGGIGFVLLVVVQKLFGRRRPR